LDPTTLRELAAVIEWRCSGVEARRSLSEDGVRELADMLIAGERPTIGWWRRHLLKSCVKSNESEFDDAA
jgi:hypothetical protein